MSLLLMSHTLSTTCLYCGGELVQDPQNLQWRHCSTCAPDWTDSIAHQTSFRTFLDMRTFAADPRGRPNRIPS